MYKYFLSASLFIIAFTVSSCCDPQQKHSNADVLYNSYSDTAIKDFPILYDLNTPTDSVYYPIYSLSIHNSGSEGDSFRLLIKSRDGRDSLYAKEYIEAGQVKTLRTYGPIPKNAPDSSKKRYITFFVSTPDSVALRLIRPIVTVSFGGTANGPEQCGTADKILQINIDSLRKQ